MKRLLPCAGFAVWLVLSGQAQADTTVQLTGIDGRSEPAAEIPAVFGGQEKGLTIEIRGATADKLSLWGDVFQVAGKLAMPLAKNVELQKDVTLPDASAHPVKFMIKFPEVKREAEIVVKLSLDYGSQAIVSPDLKRIDLGELRFEVFPTSLTKDIIDLLPALPDGSPRLCVFASGKKLRAALIAMHVPFEDAREDQPVHADMNRVLFCETTADELDKELRDQGEGTKLALFCSDELWPAGIYATTGQLPPPRTRTIAGESPEETRDLAANTVTINVTLPILDNLADDPRDQLALMKIIRLLSSPADSAN